MARAVQVAPLASGIISEEAGTGMVAGSRTLVVAKMVAGEASATAANNRTGVAAPKAAEVPMAEVEDWCAARSRQAA